MTNLYRYYNCVQIGAMTGLLICIVGLLIYKLNIDPITMLINFGVAILILLTIWFLINYVFAEYAARVIARIVAPSIVEMVIAAMPEEGEKLSHYPIRAKRNRVHLRLYSLRYQMGCRLMTDRKKRNGEVKKE